MVISSEFFFSKLQQVLFKGTNILVLVKSYSISPTGLQQTVKKLCSCVVFKDSIDHLFDNLVSGKTNYCLKKSLEEVLNFGSKNLCKPCKINHLFQSSNWTVINYQNKLSSSKIKTHTHTLKKTTFFLKTDFTYSSIHHQFKDDYKRNISNI